MAEWEAQATAALARLTHPHAAKKRATIIAIVDAEIAGRPVESIWALPTTCNRSVWWTKWSKDLAISAVLAEVRRLAHAWHDGRSLRALAQAAERLALASPVAVARAIAMLQSDDEQVVLRAAFGILDRAGVETAVKIRQEVVGRGGGPIDYREVSELSDDELARIARGGSV